MKMRILVSLAAATCFGLSSMAAAAPMKLRVANWIPNPKHPISQALEEWASKVNSESKGGLQLEVDKARVGKPSGQYDLIRKGVVDVGWGVMSLTPGRFELSQVIELPFLSPNGEKGSRMITQLWKDKFSKKEFTDTKLLAIHVHGPGQLHTKTKVTTLKDLTGLKLRTVGGGVKWVKAFGATPVVMPASAAHEALARGVADGILFPGQAITAYRLGELVPNHLEVPNGLYTIAFFFTMNQGAYDKLPGDMKAVIDANSGPDTAAFLGRAWDAADVKARKSVVADKNQTITVANEAMLKDLRDRSVEIVDSWKKLATAKGIDAEAALKALKD